MNIVSWERRIKQGDDDEYGDEDVNLHGFFFSSWMNEWTIYLQQLYNSSRTLGMLTKCLLYIEGSILSWWKGDVSGALDPWSG